VPTTSGFSYILQHPGVTASIFWQTALTNTAMQIRSFVGILGWIDAPLPAWIYPVYIALLFFIVLFESHPRISFTIIERVWIALLAFGASLFMMAIFFYPNITLGNGNLGLIQGRYYIPFGLLYLLPFSQRKCLFQENTSIWFGVMLIHFLILIISIRVLLFRYYAI
jgi:uncharacterized membrane protein